MTTIDIETGYYEVRYCDHCDESPALVDLGYIWYCQPCFDDAANDYAEWFAQMRKEDDDKKQRAKLPEPDAVVA